MRFTTSFLDLFVAVIGVGGRMQVALTFGVFAEKSGMKHWWRWDTDDRDKVQTIQVFNYLACESLFRCSASKS